MYKLIMPVIKDNKVDFIEVVCSYNDIMKNVAMLFEEAKKIGENPCATVSIFNDDIAYDSCKNVVVRCLGAYTIDYDFIRV